MSFKIKANFIDIFKIGDNINYNLKVAKELYNAYSNSEESKYLIKPIVLINTSIAEALLYDFIEYRIKKGNPTERIFEELIEKLAAKKLDKFQHYIVQAEKHDLFSLKDTNFYKAMESLRIKRNRIHIQNRPFKEPANENLAFDVKSKVLSEKVVEKIMSTLCDNFPRRPEYKFVEDFELPWESHFNKQETV